jgi:hypothetical protein
MPVFAVNRLTRFSCRYRVLRSSPLEFKMRISNFLIVASGLSTIVLGIALMSVVLTVTFQSAVHSTHNMMDQHSAL